MTRTGPQRIPGASFDLYFGGGRYSGSDMEVNCGVLHTTEGATLVNYDDGAVAPTVTLVPDFRAQRLVIHQHFDVDESARALVNAPGGVQTNTANVFQVELVGTCDPTTHAKWERAGVQHIYWPVPPDWAVRDLAWLMRWLYDNHGIPLTGMPEWLAYPASYGATRVRMSFAAWTSFRGWCGHQHVPENDHGDPGALPFTRILAVARGEQTTSEEDDMPTSQEIAAAVWTQRLPNPGRLDASGNPWMQPAQDFQVDQDRKFDLLDGQLKALDEKVAKLAAAGGVTQAQLEAAAAAGAKAALAQLAAALTPKGN